MAHFAEISNGIVIRVIVVNNEVMVDENGIEKEQIGIDFCKSLFGGDWVQTSYSGSFRKTFAGIGFEYNSTLDAFIPPQPFPSWTLDETTCNWIPPEPYPQDGKFYIWNEKVGYWESDI